MRHDRSLLSTILWTLLSSPAKRLAMIFCLLCASGIASAQGTYTAATCNYSDVNAIINGPTHRAVNGDVIIIPAGTCTWTSGIAFSGVGFTIQGQGTPEYGHVYVWSRNQQHDPDPKYSSAVPYGTLMRYSLMNISPANGLSTEDFPIKTFGVCTSSGCPSIRLDNITFGTGYVNIPSGAFTAVNNLFGVYDHNTFNQPGTGTGSAVVQLSFSAWQGIGDNGDESYYAPDSTELLRRSSLENNDLEGARGTEK